MKRRARSKESSTGKKMVDLTSWRIVRTRRDAFSSIQFPMATTEGIEFFFPEGKGLIKGWKILVEMLRGLGIKTNG